MTFGDDDDADVLGDTTLYQRGYTLNEVKAADAAEALSAWSGDDSVWSGITRCSNEREERYDEALSSLMEILAATERMQDQETVNIPITAALVDCEDAEVQVRPPGPPGPSRRRSSTEIGRLEDELAVIDRWLARNGPTTKSSPETLAKTRARRAKVERLLSRQRNS